MWTLNAAYLSFDEKIKGSIEPVKLADFVVVSKDFLSSPVDEIKDNPLRHGQWRTRGLRGRSEGFHSAGTTR